MRAKSRKSKVQEARQRGLRSNGLAFRDVSFSARRLQDRRMQKRFLVVSCFGPRYRGKATEHTESLVDVVSWFPPMIYLKPLPLVIHH